MTFEECSGQYLAKKQMAQSWVTNNTPPVKVILPEVTVCVANTTCSGFFPELSSFYEKVYRQRYPTVDEKLSIKP